MIKTSTRRWTAAFLLAALAFAQASVALAACSMDRGTLASGMTMPAGEECDACDEMPKRSAMDSANQCVAHCTADLQNVADAPGLVRSPASIPVLFVPQARSPGHPKGLIARPPGAPPHRVLLHSFLI